MRVVNVHARRCVAPCTMAEPSRSHGGRGSLSPRWRILLRQSVLTVTAGYAHHGRSDLHDGVRVLESDSLPRPARKSRHNGDGVG